MSPYLYQDLDLSLSAKKGGILYQNNNNKHMTAKVSIAKNLAQNHILGTEVATADYQDKLR